MHFSTACDKSLIVGDGSPFLMFPSHVSGSKLQRLLGCVEFHNVSFYYSSRPSVSFFFFVDPTSYFCLSVHAFSECDSGRHSIIICSLAAGAVFFTMYPLSLDYFSLFQLLFPHVPLLEPTSTVNSMVIDEAITLHSFCFLWV